jgi:WhiB family transcriptional regulator, redox-sensing transcriptional regulator
MPAPRKTRERGSVPWAAHRELPPLNIPQWMEGARCTEVDPDLHFPEKGGSTREAKTVCMGCDVRMTCLEWALENDEEFGVLGGKSEKERRKIKLERVAAAKHAAPMEATA